MSGATLTAIALVCVILVVLAGLLVRARRRYVALARTAALLAAAQEGAGAACYHLSADGGHRLGAGDAAGWPDKLGTIIDCLHDRDKVTLSEAIAQLTATGAGFDLKLSRGAMPIAATGRRVGASDQGGASDLVWLSDIAAATKLEADHLSAQQTAARLTCILNQLPVPVWWRAHDLGLAGGNLAYARSVDTDLEQALREGREFVAGPDGHAGRDQAARAELSPDPVMEEHFVVVDGSRRAVTVTEMPLSDNSGYLGFAIDRTDAREAEAELSRHVLAHAEVLEDVATAIAIYGPDMKLKFFNTAFAMLWQLEPSWLVTEPTLGEVLETLREYRRLPEHADFRKFKTQQQALFTSLVDPQEELLHLPDERTLRLTINHHPFGGLTFTYEDVTDKLALERSYNTLIEVQRETLDNLFEGIAVFGSDGRLLLSNPAYGKIWNLSPGDLENRPHIALLVEKARSLYGDEGDWEGAKARIIARVTSHTAATGRMERGDGSVLEAASLPLPDGNVLQSYLDVTDSFRVERALLERNDALETAARLKSEFIANVSYELRTPLNAIIGFAEILTNQYFGELNPRQLDYSRGILDSSQRLLSLINDILDLATIEAGYMTLEVDIVDVHTLMANVLALTRERARRLDMVLSFDCPTDLGTFPIDERRIKQAMFNLVSNAIKFTPTGGAITLSARRVGNEMALTVADTGVGIAAEHHGRVFEMFERGNPQARLAGAGLGLSLVKSFVELHGGRVELSSEAGEGTRVTCYLPMAEAQIGTTAAADETATATEADALSAPEPPSSSNIRSAAPRRERSADGSRAPRAPLRRTRS
ncbi:MAG TPA: ATP-binding protein [Stellaceae bacterium]|nr:ATP-binding protein [Stellaceae bacterium]